MKRYRFSLSRNHHTWAYAWELVRFIAYWLYTLGKYAALILFGFALIGMMSSDMPGLWRW